MQYNYRVCSKNGKRIISNGTKLSSSFVQYVKFIQSPRAAAAQRDAARVRRGAARRCDLRHRTAPRATRRDKRGAVRLDSVKRAARRPVVVGRVAVAAPLPLVARVLASVLVARVGVARVVVSVRVVRRRRVRGVRALARVLGPVVVVVARVAALVALAAARVVLLLQPLRPRRAGPAACQVQYMRQQILR